MSSIFNSYKTRSMDRVEDWTCHNRTFAKAQGATRKRWKIRCIYKRHHFTSTSSSVHNMHIWRLVSDVQNADNSFAGDKKKQQTKTKKQPLSRQFVTKYVDVKRSKKESSHFHGMAVASSAPDHDCVRLPFRHPRIAAEIRQLLSFFTPSPSSAPSLSLQNS